MQSSIRKLLYRAIAALSVGALYLNSATVVTAQDEQLNRANKDSKRVFSNTNESLLGSLNLERNTADLIDKSNETEMLSYSIGYAMGNALRHKSKWMTLKIKPFVLGHRQFYNEIDRPILALNEVNELVEGLIQKPNLAGISRQGELKQQRINSGNLHLKKIASKPNVLKLDGSDLLYEVLREGEGASPLITDIVSIHYRSKNMSGIEFLSSYDNDRPWMAPVFSSDPIAWEQALVKMKVGDIWRIYAPNALAYVNDQHPPHLLPGDPVIFELELLNVAPHPDDLRSKQN